MMTVTKKEAALAAIARGWFVFPLREDSKAPACMNGFKDASNDPERIEKWWELDPNYNIGIATGELSGLTVLDVDIKNGKAGEKSVNKLGLAMDTYMVRTPSGGWHYYYEYEPGTRSRIDVMPGIDIRSDGGYVVGAGSIIKGNSYEVIYSG